MASRLPWVWDYDIDASQFQQLLNGSTSLGRLDRDWAATRLLEYASYAEIRRFMRFADLVGGWPRWRERIRSDSRRRAFDWLVDWLPRHHADVSHRTNRVL